MICLLSQQNRDGGVAESKAIEYRNSVLELKDYDKYSHILPDCNAANGFNFLPSEREYILSELIKRKEQGKGVDMDRTTKNMLSSQAMCFNLFAPLNKDKRYATAFYNQLLGNVRFALEDIQYEYTPCKEIFRDQTKLGGVDCDAMLTYITKENEDALITIETKYVELDFSNCSFDRPKKNKKTKEYIKDYECPSDTAVSHDFSNCRYHFKKHYRYWEQTKESGLFKMDEIYQIPCPFRNDLWQLWTNMSLAYAVAKERRIKNFKFAVICPKENNKLSRNGEVFSEFRNLLNDPDKFMVIYLEDIKAAFKAIGNTGWSEEFIKRYCW